MHRIATIVRMRPENETTQRLMGTPTMDRSWATAGRPMESRSLTHGGRSIQGCRWRSNTNTWTTPSLNTETESHLVIASGGWQERPDLVIREVKPGHGITIGPLDCGDTLRQRNSRPGCQQSAPALARAVTIQGACLPGKASIRTRGERPESMLTRVNCLEYFGHREGEGEPRGRSISR